VPIPDLQLPQLPQRWLSPNQQNQFDDGSRQYKPFPSFSIRFRLVERAAYGCEPEWDNGFGQRPFFMEQGW
jgi:hypothetical protein